MRSWLLAAVAVGLLVSAGRAVVLPTFSADKAPVSPAGRAWKGAVGVGKRLYGGVLACAVREGMTASQAMAVLGGTPWMDGGFRWVDYSYPEYGIGVGCKIELAMPDGTDGVHVVVREVRWRLFD
jgi:hypothetical protein